MSKGEDCETVSPSLKKMFRSSDGTLTLRYIKDLKALVGLEQLLKSGKCKSISLLEPDHPSVLKYILSLLSMSENVLHGLHLDLWLSDYDNILELFQTAMKAHENTLIELTLKCRFPCSFIVQILKILPKNIQYLDLSENTHLDFTILNPLVSFIENSELKMLRLTNTTIKPHVRDEFIKMLYKIQTPFSLSSLEGISLLDSIEIPKIIRNNLRESSSISRRKQMRYADVTSPSRTDGNVQFIDHLHNILFMKRLVGSKVRVWWPATSDVNRTSFSGRYWPARVVRVNPIDLIFVVEYDNQELDNVPCRFIQPLNPFKYGGGLTNLTHTIMGGYYFNSLMETLNGNSPRMNPIAEKETSNHSRALEIDLSNLLPICTSPAFGSDLSTRATITGFSPKVDLSNGVKVENGTCTVDYEKFGNNKTDFVSSFTESNDTGGAGVTNGYKAETLPSQVTSLKDADYSPSNSFLSNISMLSAISGEVFSYDTAMDTSQVSTSFKNVKPEGRVTISNIDADKNGSLDGKIAINQSGNIINFTCSNCGFLNRLDCPEGMAQDNDLSLGLKDIVKIDRNGIENFQLSLNVETHLGYQEKYSGNLLVPGDICEFRDPLDADSNDPSDYIGIVKAINKTEPLYQCICIYQDNEEVVNVDSNDIRRAVVIPWYNWSSLALSVERYAIIKRDFNAVNEILSTLYTKFFYLAVVDPNRPFKTYPPNPLEMKLLSLEQFSAKVENVIQKHPKITKTIKQQQQAPDRQSKELLKKQKDKINSLIEFNETLQRELQQERNKNLELQSKFNCILCFDTYVYFYSYVFSRQINCMINPCGHFSFCHDCAKHLKFCPVCRHKITKLRILNIN
ncbi:conserved hypothetical protein [Theileria equi strain WA]|uniref:RING-type domain-containing protein n=1 Tax=Theileria equi strain WA TaxID=1537102 RepID=L1LFS6_THEEQ|nr:conserved hypothetical protein [Theileria equi strain WA]EKX74129.1 conserved hypothetical protein [Theileria equi strain WA]|eukprot:XP_004833581.1 conserved hypothetical protein [Theileria equi strain WA]